MFAVCVGRGGLDSFFSHLSFLSTFSISLGAGWIKSKGH